MKSWNANSFLIYILEISYKSNILLILINNTNLKIWKLKSFCNIFFYYMKDFFDFFFLPTLLLKNLDSSNRLCNETRLVGPSFSKNIIHAEIAMSDYAGKQVFLPWIPLSLPNDNGYSFKFKRKQILIHLWFAMTINKVQWQTIPNDGIYLHVFSHEQLYVVRNFSENNKSLDLDQAHR